MNKIEAKKRIEKLKEVIDYHRYQYHVLDKQEISDSALDSLKKELFDLEQNFPEFITKDSPTQRIGGQALEDFKKFKHPSPMLSFNDAFNFEDMSNWESRFEKVLKGSSKDGYYCELKIDGLAIELLYEGGLFSIGATRGDGQVGEDVTNNLKTIEAIPLALATKEEIKLNLKKSGLDRFINALEENYDKQIIVRGEVFLTKKEFLRINREQKELGLKEYANPRNLAAGSIRQLDPTITSSRKLDSFAYALTSDFGQKTHEEEHLLLKALGFKTNPHNKFTPDLDKVNEFRDYWEEKRVKLEYEIDGIVVTVNNNDYLKRLGVVGKTPRGAIAFKFSPNESETIVEDIIVQIGRTGTLTPVAILRPVNIGGVMVSRATLHNLDEIKRLDVKIGDTVIVGRAGDVIPDINLVIKDLRTGKERDFKMPNKCPVCSQPVSRIEDQVAYKCTNKNCPAIRRESIYHFVSKGGLDVEGLGPKIVDQLMDASLIATAADLFNLKKEDLLNLERFGEKSAENLIKSIKERESVSLNKFIYALGIDHVGSETSFDLAKKFKKLGNLRKASLEDLDKIPDVGPVVAKSISDWMSKSYNQKLLDKFQEYGLRVQEEKETLQSSKLSGKSFVMTGSLSSMTREEAQSRIRELGGDVSSAVSSKTTFLVAGEASGSKYDKASKLGVRILSEAEFLNMIQ